MAEMTLPQARQYAYRLFRNDRFEKLRELCGLLLDKRADDFDALSLSALLELKSGKRADAEAIMARVEAAYPEILRFWVFPPHPPENDAALLRRWTFRLLAYNTRQLTDRYLISYPKCGRTWLRLMLGRYALAGREGNPLRITEIALVDPSFAGIAVSHDDFPHLKPAADANPDKSIYAACDVLLLVRDPRDVLVSNYFQYTRRGDHQMLEDARFRGSLGEFLRSDIGGLPALVRFYNDWARSRAVPRRFLQLSYEAMRRAPEQALRQAIDFFGWPDRGAAAVAEAVDYGRFERMQALERSDGLKTNLLRPGNPDDPETYKVRRGKVGGYRDYLTPQDLAYVEAYLADELDDYYADYKPR